MRGVKITIDEKAVIFELTTSEAFEEYDSNREGFKRYFKDIIKLNNLALIIIKKPLAARPNTDRDKTIN
ncbi:hypothetical protein [Macrococcus brunensis]|uniref:hypothetical protein n=1 Tax=Macrococcus brunensis TaxID=198483 RepID=UPI001EF11BD1|nr:hypothetical protein [Macrococcus brunensis]ULG71176.1 hypothetical protein MGG12_07430 [Macrococcus brunensis]